jgi:alpha-mannosidase
VAVWRAREVLAIEGWRANGCPISPGDCWPAAIPTRFESVTFTVPAHWPLEETRLQIDSGGESLLTIAYDEGNAQSFGHDIYHAEYPLVMRSGSLVIDAVPRGLSAMPIAEPRFGTAQLVWIEPELDRLLARLKLLRLTAEALGGHDVVGPLLELGEAALAGFLPPTRTSAYLRRLTNRPTTAEDTQLPSCTWSFPHELATEEASLTDYDRAAIARADVALIEALRGCQRRYPPIGQLTLTGHAHIDLAWLWPLEETWQKVRRSFSTVADLIERYPEFRFGHSTAAIYDHLERHEPELFATIARQAKAGAWEPTGGLWVEMDPVMPTGESLLRQGLYGQRYFECTFGQRSRTAWLPDSFGFCANLPQVLRQVGLDSMFTSKLAWSETNGFPHSSFNWIGLNGSALVVHNLRDLKPGYNGTMDPADLLNTWRMHAEKHCHPEALYCLGHGDGGGGPTSEMIEGRTILADMPVLPKISFDRIDAFFERLREPASRDALPRWWGELYLEFHRGVFTSQGRFKRLHRQAEQGLIQAEAIEVMAHMLGCDRPRTLEAAWRILLQNQFHDILPGSSIREVYERAEAELASVIDQAGARRCAALDNIAHALGVEAGAHAALLVNVDSLSQPARAVLAAPLPGTQLVEGGHLFALDRPVTPFTATIRTIDAPAEPVCGGDRLLENRYLRVEIDAQGQISRIWDKEHRREVLSAPGNALIAYVDNPKFYDAWEIDEDYERHSVAAVSLAEPRLMEAGPFRAAIRTLHGIRNSRIEQDIRLWSNSRRIDIHTRLTWGDRRLLLKTIFPLNVRSDFATFETAFGVVQRPTVGNTSFDAAKFEVPGHRFAHLGEPGYGVALMNDGRYGYRVRPGALELSLLRSPVWPDFIADEGQQELTYSLYPHGGSWHDAGLLEEAIELNRPLGAKAVGAAADDIRVIDAPGTAAALGALKPSEDGEDLILRLYEPFGARGPIAIRPADGWRTSETVNALEDPEGTTGFTPFQVMSWRLIRAR